MTERAPRYIGYSYAPLWIDDAVAPPGGMREASPPSSSSFITPTGSNTVIYSKNIHSKKHKKAAYRNNTIYKIKV